MYIFLPRFGNISVIISLNKLSALFFFLCFLWESHNAYVVSSYGVPQILIGFLLFNFCFSEWIIYNDCIQVYCFFCFWSFLYGIFQFSHFIVQIQNFCLVLLKKSFISLLNFSFYSCIVFLIFIYLSICSHIQLCLRVLRRLRWLRNQSPSQPR